MDIYVLQGKLWSLWKADHSQAGDVENQHPIQMVFTTGQHLQHGFYLVLLYLLISGNYLNHLLGCKIHSILENTLWLKHLLGFMTTYFLIVLAIPPDSYGHRETVGFAAVIYIWFYLTTRMNATFWIPMITLATLAYFIYVYIGQRKMRDIFAMRAKNIQEIAIVVAGLLTIVGVVVHYGERKIAEGSRFRAWTFWTEEARNCKDFHQVDVPILKSLKVAFGF